MERKLAAFGRCIRIDTGSKDATHREHAAGEMLGGTRGKYQ